MVARIVTQHTQLALWLGIGWLVAGGASPCAAGDAESARASLVKQLAADGIRDRRVLSAMGRIPRHLFVPERLRDQAYADQPLPIGLGQTISQPYIVAYMTAALQLRGGEKVLEVGTGSGYQAAVLAEVAGVVFSIEILPELSQRAQAALARAGVDNVRLRVGDGWEGWPEEAPFDGILVTAAPRRVPPHLVAQLREGARLVIPVGESGDQTLITYLKREGHLVEVDRLPVRFVPMTGRALR